MSGQSTAWPYSERIQIRSLQKAGKAALQEVDKTYGTGYPNYRPGKCDLAYHNGHHSRDVGETAFMLCTRLGMSPRDCEGGRTGGNSHDVRQLLGLGRNEAESVLWLEQELAKDNQVDPELREWLAIGIFGTEPIIVDGVVVGQKATQLTYPTKQAEMIGFSLSSSDLGELYTPFGSYFAHQLFREIEGMVPPAQLSMKKFIRFQEKQIIMMEGYRFPLPLAEKLLTKHKTKAIAHAKSVLAKTKSGELETWEQVVAFDLTFARSLS